jgi:hypothetical protein
MTIVKGLAVVALLVGGTSLVIAQSGAQPAASRLWRAAQQATPLLRGQIFRLALGLIMGQGTTETCTCRATHITALR